MIPIEAKHYVTTDRDSILTLLTAGLPILETDVDEHNKVRFHFDNEAAFPIMDQYRKNASQLFEMSAFLRALRMFNGIVHSKN